MVACHGMPPRECLNRSLLVWFRLLRYMFNFLDHKTEYRRGNRCRFGGGPPYELTIIGVGGWEFAFFELSDAVTRLLLHELACCLVRNSAPAGHHSSTEARRELTSVLSVRNHVSGALKNFKTFSQRDQ